VKSKADEYHGVLVATNPYSAACGSADCFSLTIQNCEFKYFGIYKTLLTSLFVSPPTFRYQGSVLNLVNFAGDVTLKSNTFTYNYAMIDGCSPTESLPSSPTENNDYIYLPVNGTIYQLKAVISIIEHPRTIIIGDNTFEQNAGVKGIILLESSKQKTYPIYIINNSFTK
jgi:hypothetical protein